MVRCWLGSFTCFNEAAVSQPRKLAAPGWYCRDCTVCFNEAAVSQPRKRENSTGTKLYVVGFNEAAVSQPRKHFAVRATFLSPYSLQ